MFLGLDWLTDNEIEKIKLQVHSLRNNWTRMNPKLNFYTLGSACYLNQKNDSVTNELMHHHFDWVFESAILKLQSLFNIGKITVLDELTTPGFHIFTGPVEKYKLKEYHVDDSIKNLYPESLPKYSFTTLIENISDPPAHLDYKKNGSTFQYEYEVGKFNVWDCYIPHKIGSVNSISEGEYRITFQGHVAEIDGENKIYF